MQETLVLALERPPREAGSLPVLRSWLQTVLRRRVSSARRGERRRAGREERAARDDSEPGEDAARIVGRAESARLLVDCLTTLAEPHRSILVLHYFEGMAPSQIAVELGLGGAAVRTRLVRARDALRAHLDQRHRGERNTWLRALSPLAGLSQGTALKGSTLISIGSTLMSKLVLAVAAAIALTVLMVRFSDRPAPAPSAGDARSEEPTTVGGPSLRPEAPTERRALEAEILPGDSSGRPIHVAVGADGLFRPLLFGRVLDSEQRPIAGARLRATWGAIEVDGGVEVEGVSGPDGRYELVLPARAWISEHAPFPGREQHPLAEISAIVFCSAAGFHQAIDSAPYPADEPSVLEVSFELKREELPEEGLRIHVVDPLGAPVAGASIALFSVEDGKLHQSEQAHYFWIVADRQGRAEFRHRPLVPTIPFAMTRTGLAGRGEVIDPGHDGPWVWTLGLSENDGLRGTVREETGELLADVEVKLLRSELEPEPSAWNLRGVTHNLSTYTRPWAGFEESWCRVRTDARGAFAVGHLAPGSYWARLDDGSVHGPFALGETLDLAVALEASVFLRAVDHEGRVLRRASLFVYDDSTTYSGGSLPDRMGYQRFPLEEGTWRAAAYHGDGKSSWRDIELPRNRGDRIDLVVDFTAEPVPVRLRAVTASDGSPLPARYRLWRTSDDPVLQRERGNIGDPLLHSATAEGWTAALRQGSYIVEVTPQLAGDDGWIPVRTTLDVEPETTEFTQPIERGGRLTFRWQGALASSPEAHSQLRVTIRPVGSDGYWASTSTSGGVFVDGRIDRHGHGRAESLGPSHGPEQPGPVLAAGDYDVRVTAEGVETFVQRARVASGENTIVGLALDPSSR